MNREHFALLALPGRTLCSFLHLSVRHFTPQALSGRTIYPHVFQCEVGMMEFSRE